MANTPRTTVGKHGSNRARTVWPPHGVKTQLGAPDVVSAPFITGTPTQGATLDLNYGSWSPQPTSFVVQWLRSGAPIQGANAATYLLTAADVGSTITASVTASNQTGSKTVITAPTPVVITNQPPTYPPAFSTQPSIVGSATAGSFLTAFPGIVTGNPTPSLDYLWLADGVSTGITTQTYTVTVSDIGKRLSVRVTATNTDGTATATSSQTQPVIQVAPPPEFRLGVNMSGMEYSNSETDIDIYAITIPDSQLLEMKTKGFDHIRVPLKWDRIERTKARNVLDPTNWGNVIDLLTRCKAIGLQVIPDIHNFGARVVQPNKTTVALDTSTFTGPAWSAFGATLSGTGFTEDNSPDGDHTMTWTGAVPQGDATVSIKIKANPSYTGLGSYKWNHLVYPINGQGGQEVGFRTSDRSIYAGNNQARGSATGPDANGFYTITQVLPVSADSGNFQVIIGSGASSGAYAGNHYNGTAGQQPFIIGNLNITVQSTAQYYKGIGENLPDGTPALPPSDLAATWSRMVTDIRAKGLEDVILGYDIQNEPNSVVSVDVWQTTAQLCINAIRATGSTKIIFIEGKPYSGAVTFPEINPNLWKLTDPANNLIFSGHTYGDPDNSGGATGLGMSWAACGGKPVEIPVDPVGNPNEVVDEMTLVRRNDHMLQWLKSKGISRMHMGEGGVGRDSIHWNNQLRNMLTWAQANKVIITVWAGGGLGDGYELGWSAYADGLQREQMAVIDELKGNPVPTYYRVTVPPRIAQGASTIPIEVKYNGLIPSAITFTPSDNGAGGSFNPTTITTDTTENWVGTITYTPAANKNGTITVSNNKGWATPAGKPFSSYTDVFQAPEAEGVSTNRVFSIYRRLYKSYTGPLIRLWKQVGGSDVEQDFGRATGSEIVDTAAITAWIAGADGGVIKVAKIYDQGPAASLTGRNNIQARIDIDGGWPAPSSADYPLWINNAGDGKPVARWTGTGSSSMDFADNMLQRSNATIVGLLKHTSGSNDLHWQFQHNFGVFPVYLCDQDGASLSYNQTTGTWSYFAASRKRNSVTGTNIYLNGTKVATFPTLDNTIQVNPTGAGGPDYRDACQMGYYRFTPGTNQGAFDFRELSTFEGNPSDTALTAMFTDANSAYTVVNNVSPTLLSTTPDYSIDFDAKTIKTAGIAGTFTDWFKGGDYTVDAAGGLRVTSGLSGRYLTGPMVTAMFGDNVTIRFTMANPDGAGNDLLTRDGTRWMYTNNGQQWGLKFSAADEASFDYVYDDAARKVILVSRGRTRKMLATFITKGIGPSLNWTDASGDAPLSAPTQLRIGTGTSSTRNTNLIRIDVWTSDIQDETQIGDFAGMGTYYGLTKGANLSDWYNGHNLAGLEFNQAAGPFEEETDYYSGNSATGRVGYGANLYRLPFLPDRLFTSWITYLQNTGSNPFPTVGNTTVAGMDPTYKAQMDRLIQYNISRGYVTLLDWHGYGGPLGQSIGGTFSDALFAQVWKACAQAWTSDLVHFDFQNEPAAATRAGLATTYQAAVTAIRSVTGATGYIHLEPTGGYGPLGNFRLDVNDGFGNDLLAVTDPLNRLVFHGHYYLDGSGSSAAANSNWFAYLGDHQGAIDWARKHGVKLFWGEFGATWDPANNPANDTAMRKLLALWYRNRDVCLGWAAWGSGIYWGSGYPFNTWPANWNTPQETSRPQLSYFKLYPGTTYVPPTIPSGPPTITPGTETDVSALASAVVNTYQTDIRVDPTNANRQVITGKYGNDPNSSENNTVALVTNNRWSSATFTTQGASGDPDCVFDKDGNAYWTIIDKGNGTNFGIRKKAAGSTTWGSLINGMAARPDHPHVVADLWPTSPYYNRMYAAGTTPGPRFSRSSDGGATWGNDYAISGFDAGGARTNNPLMFGGCVAKTGEVFFNCRTGAKILVQNGAYAGSTKDMYVCRSADGGATWTAIRYFTNNSPKTQGPGGSYNGGSNVGYTPPTAALPNGRLHVTANAQPANGAATGSMYFYSDDLGVTWSAAGTYLAYDASQGHLCGCFSATATGMLVYTYMTGTGSVNRMYAIASRDSGATWSTPVKVNSTDWAQPDQSLQAREPSGDQVYAGVSLADNTFEVCWPQNVGGIYHAFRRQLTVV